MSNNKEVIYMSVGEKVADAFKPGAEMMKKLRGEINGAY